MGGDSEQGKNPYTVEIEDDGCDHCSVGRTWIIVDPEDVSSSTSYGDLEEAEYICEGLNAAFQAGVESVMDQLRLINYVKIAREFDAEKPQGTAHQAIVFALLKCAASLSLQGRKQEK